MVMLGHSMGTVTVWTPSMKVPAAKILVHRQPGGGRGEERELHGHLRQGQVRQDLGPRD